METHIKTIYTAITTEIGIVIKTNTKTTCKITKIHMRSSIPVKMDLIRTWITKITILEMDTKLTSMETKCSTTNTTTITTVGHQMVLINLLETTMDNKWILVTTKALKIQWTTRWIIKDTWMGNSIMEETMETIRLDRSTITNNIYQMSNCKLINLKTDTEINKCIE